MLKDLYYLFYPTQCAACSTNLTQQERIICIDCRHQLPLYKFHYHNAEILKKVFSGRILIEEATALFVFEKSGPVQNLIHNLKYRGQQKIGTELGKWLGSEMAASQKYKDVDIVLPVPLHPKRYRQRGYNQVANFGKEVAKSLQIPYREDILKRIIYAQKQAKSKENQRWQLDAEAFMVTNNECIKNKHILIVDDLMTTGATLEACVNRLHNSTNLKVSIAVIAMAI